MKYMKDFTSHFKERNSFTIRDARIFLKEKKISNKYLHFLIHSLLKKGMLKRLSRGVYTFKNDIIVAGFAFKPFYYGLQQALSLHNLWQQATNPVIITTKKARSGVRKIMESNVVVKRIKPSMFYGFEQVKHFEHWVPVSTIEKTIIDFAYFKQKLPQEAKKQALKKANSKKMQELLKKAPKWVKKRIKKVLQEKS